MARQFAALRWILTGMLALVLIITGLGAGQHFAAGPPDNILNGEHTAELLWFSDGINCAIPVKFTVLKMVIASERYAVQNSLKFAFPGYFYSSACECQSTRASIEVPK